MAVTSYTIQEYLPSSTWYSFYHRIDGKKNVPYIIGTHKAPLQYRRVVYAASFQQLYGTSKSSIGGTKSVAFFVNAVNKTSTTVAGKGSVRVLHKALERLNNKLKPNQAELGAALAESRSSLSMIENRLMRIYRSYKSIRKGDLKGGLNLLVDTEMKKQHKKLPKWKIQRDASSLWLEYWFGWTPLLGDIYNAAQTISAPSNLKRFRVRASSTEVLLDSGSTGTVTKTVWESSTKIKGMVGAQFEISNPNLFLANQLGLVNPASVLWELVPFSFVGDWILNINQFIGSLTEYAGLTLSNSYHSVRVTTTFTESVTTGLTNAYVWNGGQNEGFNRFVGFPSTTVLARLVRGLSTTRAATAASLVVAIFAPKRS